MAKVGSKLGPSWGQVGVKFGRSWAKLQPNWARLGQVGTKLGPSWGQVGFKMQGGVTSKANFVKI
eukprot:2944717-Karenia_brevis.AAC.1